MTITDRDDSVPAGAMAMVATADAGVDDQGVDDQGVDVVSDRLADRRVWLVVTAIFIPFAAVFFFSSASFSVRTVETTCGEPPLDVRFTSSAGDVDGFLDSCGEVGRQAYRNMLLADVAYPAVFGLFLATSLALVLRRVAPGGRIRGRRVAWLAWLPVLGAVFDYLENALAWRALDAYPATAGTNALLGLASAAKTSTFWIAGLVLVVSLGSLAVRALAGRRRPTAA